jgi:uncharacterized protein with ParB-like and HNH nuclease domain
MDEEFYVGIPEEKEQESSNDDLFNITSWGADPSVRELIMQYQDGDIEKPELQRKYVWTKKAASRFIESLLLGLPVPSIFLANLESGKRLIIDGYQRIRTLVDYIDEGIWGGDGTVFRLSNTELINKRWRGKSFKELDEDDKRRLRNYSLHAIIFEQKQPQNDSGLYQVFERINTSGTPLNDQEIRNCVYQGNLNTLLFQLNENPMWREFNNGPVDSRMRDIELILRFFALGNPDVYHSTDSVITLKHVLNKYMSDNSNATVEFLESQRRSFESVISFIYEYLGVEAFFNLQNDLEKLRRRLYPTVYDSIMIATSIALSQGFIVESDVDMKQRRLALLKDPDYRNSITQGTMRVENIKMRISKALSILYHIENYV